MLTKSTLMFSAVAALGLIGGAVSPALAEYDYGLYGGPHQTWCQVDPNCNGWNRALRASPPAGNARAFAVTPAQKHRPVHKHGRADYR